MIDGDPATYWHSRWKTNPTRNPHELVIDFGAPLKIDAVVYRAREDMENGRVRDYEVYFSGDGKTWAKPALAGRFENDADEAQEAQLPRPVVARFQRDYFALPTTFNPTKFDPASWAKSAKNCGMRYVVYTTKHHDGFCMFDTKLTGYKVTFTRLPFPHESAGRYGPRGFRCLPQEGFAIGVYFSKADWHNADYWDPARHAQTRNPNYDTAAEPEKWRRFVAFVYGQIEELMSNYGPVSLLFLDAGQVRPPQQDLQMDRLAAMARRHQPGLIIADRTVGGRYENYLTPEQEVPGQAASRPLGNVHDHGRFLVVQAARQI